VEREGGVGEGAAGAGGGGGGGESGGLGGAACWVPGPPYGGQPPNPRPCR